MAYAGRPTYLRQLIEGYEVKEAPTAEWVQRIHLLSGMANNLNQIARMSHATGAVTEKSAIYKMQNYLKCILEMVSTKMRFSKYDLIKNKHSRCSEWRLSPSILRVADMGRRTGGVHNYRSAVASILMVIVL